MSGLSGVPGAKRFRAFRASLAGDSNAEPWNWLLPDLVLRLMTPPLKRPNSAGGVLVTTLNSWIASMTGKYATVPGSGCSTEMPS